ncbi:MAG TPA: helix-hairpin-helix domain-containing protein [Acidiferrobacteraceae bacterium]|jgi:competence protein ComEA|nr:helix-hairpin-helix domain-containing protein [Acidiferrobacteraceae bacterium]HEX20185.1 helix-hairpin-helix domain-containing protein [Acidiferrobacteraceae bacterium]
MKIIRILFLVLCLSFASLNANAEPVNINKADVIVLAERIKGVGPKLAKSIVMYRKKHGPFKSVDELQKVKGIGSKLVEKNRKELTVGSLKK